MPTASSARPRPIARQRALEEGVHPLVDVLAQLRHRRFRDAPVPNGLHQFIDLAGRDAVDPGLLDDGDQRLLHRLPRLQEAGEVGSAAHLRDFQVQRAQPGVERPVSVAIAPGLPGLAALVAPGPDQAIDIGLHDQLQHALGNRPQKIRSAALRGKLCANLSSVIGFSVSVRSKSRNSTFSNGPGAHTGSGQKRSGFSTAVSTGSAPRNYTTCADANFGSHRP